MNHQMPGNRPEWLPEAAARVIAGAAGALLIRRDSPEEAKAAVRAAAAGCLPSLPAPMLAEVVAAVAPAEAPPPDDVTTELVPVDAGKLAERLGFLAGGADGPMNAATGELAARLAAAGAALVERHARSGQSTAQQRAGAAGVAPASS